MGERLERPQKGLYRLDWEDDEPGVEFHPGMADMLAILRANGFELLDFRELFAPEDALSTITTSTFRSTGPSAGLQRRSGV